MDQKITHIVVPGAPKDSYCRLCLTTITSSTLNLFAPFNTARSIAKVVADFAKVEILETDSYSKLICLECLDKLTATTQFKTVIRNADYHLKNQFISQDDDLCNEEVHETKENILSTELDIKDEPLNDSNEINITENLKVLGKQNIASTELEKAQSVVRVKKKRRMILKQCPDCDKTFKSYGGLRAHSYTHSGKYRFICPICNKGFGDKGAFDTHTAIHKNVTPYQCEVCGKGFKCASGLWNHKSVHSETKSFLCDQCDKSFTSKFRLKAHSAIHTTELNHICDICNLSFKTKGARSMHNRRTHMTQPTEKCQICSKFVTHLNIHMRIHIKPFICHICNQSFGNKNVLKQHINTHTGEKTYACDVCQKTFTHPASLHNHKLIHDNPKRFQCEVCAKKFNYKQSLQLHLANNHQRGLD